MTYNQMYLLFCPLPVPVPVCCACLHMHAVLLLDLVSCVFAKGPMCIRILPFTPVLKMPTFTFPTAHSVQLPPTRLFVMLLGKLHHSRLDRNLYWQSKKKNYTLLLYQTGVGVRTEIKILVSATTRTLSISSRESRSLFTTGSRFGAR